jgi:hypothetical protein
MGLIGKVLGFTRTERNSAKVSDVKTDPGGGALLTSDNFQQSGTDSHPLAGDYAILVGTQGTGRYSVAGYVDPKNAQTSAPGEWRAYSRKADGTQAAQVWTKNDGTVLIGNGNGLITMRPDGVVDINGFIIGLDGNGTTANGISLDGHTHAQGVDSAGNTQAETEAPTV